MFDKIFLSPQVKRNVIVSNKHGIHELPQELPNNLRLKTAISQKNCSLSEIFWPGLQFQTSFCFLKKALYEVKASRLQFSFSIFRQPLTWHATKANSINLQTIDLEICSILIFYKRVWEQFLYHILRMIFQEK